MRAWILEYAPEHEPVDRIGVYGSPQRAGDDFLTQVGRLRERSAKLGMVTIEHLAKSTDIVLIVRSGGLSTSDDWIILTGAHVKGTANRQLSALDQDFLETLRNKILP